MVLGLYADLMVNRGRIPAYRDLPQNTRESFKRTWTETLARDKRKQRLEQLGVDEKAAEELAESDKIDARYQALFWRTQVHSILQQRVGAVAAGYVLPEYHDLPPLVQAGFQQSWQQLTEAQRLERLEKLADRAAALAALDPGKYTTDLHDLLWRAHLYYLLKDKAGEEAAEAFWNDR